MSVLLYLSQCYSSLGVFNPVVSLLNAFFTTFFFFSGADIVQWLMKNLSIEDPGKVTIAGEEQILHLYRVCH